jgi:putative addiction module killer protein
VQRFHPAAHGIAHSHRQHWESATCGKVGAGVTAEIARRLVADKYPKEYNRRMKAIHTTDLFMAWFAGLRDKQAMRRIQARIDRAEDGNFGDCEPVGEGVSEMRIHYGPGYRVYFTQRGMEIVILLAGGDKSTQASDIKAALKLARQL